MRKYGYFLITLVVLVAAPALFAASAPSANSNNVTANVSNVCKIASFSITFGAYDPVVTNNTTPLDAPAAPVNVYCTKGTAPTSITMGVGTSGAGTVATRTMTGYTDATYATGNGVKLDYEIYLDSGHLTIWNDTTGVIAPNASTNFGTALTNSVGNAAINAYGRVPAAQNVIAGYYRDTVQATVNF